MPKGNGLGKSGIYHGRTHLTENDVREIRRLSALPKPQRPKQAALARRYGIARSTIALIVTYRTWRILGDETE